MSSVPIALIAAMFFTVALLVVTAYFLLGSAPLLVLKYDTPLDGRFVRGFFNTYYLAAIFTASATAISFAFLGKLVFAAGAAALALLAIILRWKIIPKMDTLRVQMLTDGTHAIPAFRRIHVTAMVVNLVQLVIIVWGLLGFSVK